MNKLSRHKILIGYNSKPSRHRRSSSLRLLLLISYHLPTYFFPSFPSPKKTQLDLPFISLFMMPFIHSPSMPWTTSLQDAQERRKLFNTIVHSILSATQPTELVFKELSPKDGHVICNLLASSSDVESRRSRYNILLKKMFIRVLD